MKLLYKMKYVWIVCILNIAWSSSAMADDSSRVRFWTFLKGPVQLQELVFQRSEYPDHQASNILKPGLTLIFPKNPVFSVIWQESAFYVRAIPPEDFSLTNGEMTIRSQDLSWSSGATEKSVWRSKSGQIAFYRGALQVTNIGNHLHDLVREERNKAMEVIHMGIKNVLPGSFTVSGNNWEAQTIAGEKIIGEAILNENGERVHQIKYRVEGSRVRFKIEYFYDLKLDADDNEPLLPHHFRRIQESANPKESPDLTEVDIKIQKMVVASNSVERLVVEKERSERMRLEDQASPVFEVTRDAVWNIDSYGKRQMVETNAEVVLPDKDARDNRRVWVIALLTVTSIGGFFLILKAKYK